MNQIVKTLVALLVSLPQLALAQNARIELGIEAGLNSSQFINNEADSYNNLYNTEYSGNISPSGGVNFQVNAKRFFSFKTGVSFDRKVYTIRTEQGSSQIGSTYQRRDVNTFDYVSVPLLGKLTFGKKVQFFLNAGMYFAFLADQNRLSEGSSSEIFQGQSYYHEFSSSKSTMDSYKRYDFGLIGGLGLGVPIKKHWHVSLEAREVIGLMNVYSTTKYNTPPTQHATFHLLLGVSYKLGLRE